MILCRSNETLASTRRPIRLECIVGHSHDALGSHNRVGKGAYPRADELKVSDAAPLLRAQWQLLEHRVLSKERGARDELSIVEVPVVALHQAALRIAGLARP